MVSCPGVGNMMWIPCFGHVNKMSTIGGWRWSWGQSNSRNEMASLLMIVSW
jgi:hypothetical protein